MTRWPMCRLSTCPEDLGVKVTATPCPPSAYGKKIQHEVAALINSKTPPWYLWSPSSSWGPSVPLTLYSGLSQASLGRLRWVPSPRGAQAAQVHDNQQGQLAMELRPENEEWVPSAPKGQWQSSDRSRLGLHGARWTACTQPRELRAGGRHSPLWRPSPRALLPGYHFMG